MANHDILARCTQLINESGSQRSDNFGGQRGANQTSNVIGLDECIPVDVHVFRS